MAALKITTYHSLNIGWEKPRMTAAFLRSLGVPMERESSVCSRITAMHTVEIPLRGYEYCIQATILNRLPCTSFWQTLPPQRQRRDQKDRWQANEGTQSARQEAIRADQSALDFTVVLEQNGRTLWAFRACIF